MKSKNQNLLPKGVTVNKSKLKRKQAVWAWAMLSPTLILFTVFTVIPLIMAVYLSFTDFELFGTVSDALFVGLHNYKEIFDGSIKSTDFWRSVKNVLLYVVMSVPLTVIGSFMMAVLVNTKLRGVKFFRFVYYLPAVTSGVATAFCWKWLLNYNYGLINELIVALGGERINWLSDYSYLPLFSIAIIATWGGLGGNMLIYLAALKGINPEMYEAASLDGAGPLRKILDITLPSVRPTTFFILTMSLIGAFQLFDTVWFVTGESVFTQTPVLLIYNMAFRRFDAGFASAMSVVLFLIIMVVTFVTQRTVEEKQ